MDKNLAALLRQDCRTIKVRVDTTGYGPTDEDTNPATAYVARRANTAAPAPKSEALYTYVTQLEVHEGDTVVVPTRDTYSLATVVRVDDDVDIEPQADKVYRWVIDVVDMRRHNENARRNREIESLAADAQRASMRQVFAQNVVGQVTGPRHEQLVALLGAPKADDTLAS